MNAASALRLPAFRLGVAIGVALLSSAEVSRAQEVPWPRCSERLDGQSLCGQGSVCECHYDSGGVLTGRVAAWRWSCDILRMCGPPVPAGVPDQTLPPGFTYAPSMSISPDASVPTAPERRVPYRRPGSDGP